MTKAQISSLDDSVKYQKQSNFIKEFKIPIGELGLKGITTDNKGNAWFYHSTNKTSSVFKFNQTTNEFKQYNVTADTVVDDFVINLAGGQLVFDDKRNLIWFTDARTNSIGKLDIENENIQLFSIPTESSGPMGIVISPDNETIWFTEILANKIGTFAIDDFVNNGTKSDSIKNRKQIIEYPVNVIQSNVNDDKGQNGGEGPTLLAFDNEGTLWVTMSYSHNILRVEPWILKSGNMYNAFTYFTLPNTNTFSPFGITFAPDETSNNNANNNTTTTKGNFFITDHGSSRVIKTLHNSNAISPFQNYLSYWTSPSSAFPASLPSQIAVDNSEENVYFAQHGGNKISKINLGSGIMTEYDIPTGPLSTTVFIAVSNDDKKVWFTEYLSNKIAYLDTTIPVPYQIQILINNDNNNNNNQEYAIFKNLPKTFDAVLINQNNVNSTAAAYNNNNTDTNYSALLDDIQVSITGMTDSGIVGIQPVIEPKIINLVKNPISYSKINLINDTSPFEKRMENDGMIQNDKSAVATTTTTLQRTNHTIMARASAFAGNQSSISLLYPIILDFDIPLSSILPIGDSSENSRIANNMSDIYSSQYKEEESIFNMSAESIRNILRTVSLPIAIGLIGFLIYRKIKEKRTKIKEK